MRYYQFCSPNMLFLIFIMKINMKDEFGFLITHSPLCPLRLCASAPLRDDLIEKFIRVVRGRNIFKNKLKIFQIFSKKSKRPASWCSI